MRTPVRVFPAILASALLLAFASIPAHADSEGHFDRTLTVTGPVNLDVQTGSGDIVVHPGTSGTVEIHAKIHASGWHMGGDIDQRIRQIETNPPIEQNGNTIRIGHTDDRDLYRDISISYDLTVPAETQLRSASGSGDERIQGISGPADASSGSGGLQLTNIGGETHARSGSGDIALTSIHGSARATTGSGSIQAMGIAGGFTASSGSGDVRVEQTAAGDVEVATGSGTVELKGADGAVRVQTGSGNITAQGQPAGDWTLRTASGDVDVEFPASAGYELSAHSGSGSIHTTAELTTTGTIGPRALHGKVHGGGSLVELSTSSGSINIH
jgi:Putative adhesin